MRSGMVFGEIWENALKSLLSLLLPLVARTYIGVAFCRHNYWRSPFPLHRDNGGLFSDINLVSDYLEVQKECLTVAQRPEVAFWYESSYRHQVEGKNNPQQIEMSAFYSRWWLRLQLLLGMLGSHCPLLQMLVE